MAYYQKQLFDGTLPGADPKKVGPRAATLDLCKETVLKWDGRNTLPENPRIAIVRIEDDSPGATSANAVIVEILPGEVGK